MGAALISGIVAWLIFTKRRIGIPVVVIENPVAELVYGGGDTGCILFKCLLANKSDINIHNIKVYGYELYVIKEHGRESLSRKTGLKYEVGIANPDQHSDIELLRNEITEFNFSLNVANYNEYIDSGLRLYLDFHLYNPLNNIKHKVLGVKLPFKNSKGPQLWYAPQIEVFIKRSNTDARQEL